MGERKGKRGAASGPAPHPGLEPIVEVDEDRGWGEDDEDRSETHEDAPALSVSKPCLSGGDLSPPGLRDVGETGVPRVVVVPVTEMDSCDVGASVSRAGGFVTGAEALGDEGPVGPRMDQVCTGEDEMPECDTEEEPRGDRVHAAFVGVASQKLPRGDRRKAEAHVKGHARFLQHLFRGYVRLRPGIDRLDTERS